MLNETSTEPALAMIVMLSESNFCCSQTMLWAASLQPLKIAPGQISTLCCLLVVQWFKFSDEWCYTANILAPLSCVRVCKMTTELMAHLA